MAVNDMIVRIIGDSRSVERAFARSSKAADQFNRNVTTTGAKLDSSAKKFSGFARGAAVGFGGAFAVTEGINIVKNLASVAAESQQVLGQTQVALESTGKSWAQYGQQIQETVKAQSRLGFDDEALLRTFSQFQRTTGDVGKALQLNNLAMDVARARYIDLEQAAALVTKAAIGNAGALRRLGIDVDTNATRTQLLTALTEKYGGAATKAADDSSTTFARTQVAIENLQESVGTLLLPALEQLAGGLEEVAEFATNVSDGLGVIGKTKIPKIEIPFIVTIGGSSVGSAVGKGINIAKFTPLNPLFGVTIANEIAKQFKDQAEAATPGLSASINQSVNNMISTALQSSTFGITTLPSFTLPGAETGDAAKRAKEIIDQANGNLQAVLASQIKTRDQLGRNLEVARATFKDQKKINAAAIAYANAQAAVINTRQQIASNDKAAADAAKSSAKSAADAAQSARQKAAADRQAAAELAKSLEQIRQFRALGLDATGAKPPPTIANLLKRISQVSKTDISKNERGVLARIRAVLVDPLKKATPETRAAAKGLIDGIRDELDVDKKLVGPLTRTTSLNANKMLSGILGITPEAERELRQRLSKFNSAGLSLAGARGPTGQFRGGVPSTTTNVTVEIDGEAVGRATRKTDQKNRRRNPVQKRGSRRGGV